MLKVFAPAKVNLHLHVTGRRDDGYHTLDSLVMFADIGDVLTFEKTKHFSFAVEGPFAEEFVGAELETSPQSKNLVVRAAWRIANLLARELDVRITLQKNLPLGGGIGGGSADAAACLWGLCQLWNVSLPETHKSALALQLGSDVPVCLKSETCIMQGTGEIFKEAPELAELPVLLVWPGAPTSTAAVFQALELSKFSSPAKFPAGAIDQIGTLCAYLNASTRNDLTAGAISFLPTIKLALDLIKTQPGCQLSRLSGSGSTCFGIFENEDQLAQAAEIISLHHPTWWVRTGWLNRVSRY